MDRHFPATVHIEERPFHHFWPPTFVLTLNSQRWPILNENEAFIRRSKRKNGQPMRRQQSLKQPIRFQMMWFLSVVNLLHICELYFYEIQFLEASFRVFNRWIMTMTHSLWVIDYDVICENCAPELGHIQSTSKRDKSFSLVPRPVFHISS